MLVNIFEKIIPKIRMFSMLTMYKHKIGTDGQSGFVESCRTNLLEISGKSE